MTLKLAIIIIIINNNNNNNNNNNSISASVKRNSIEARKEQTADDIVKEQKIRYGRYVLAWRMLPFRMSVALIVEMVVGFLAILTASGKFQTLPTIVSFLYLAYIFSSSKTGNTVGYLQTMYEEMYPLHLRHILPTIFIVIPIFIPAMITLDLLQVHQRCISPQSLSFAAADMVIIIFSINYASRAPDLATAIPLLVSFDFITKFSTQIVDSITISDDDAREQAADNDDWLDEFGRMFIILMPSVIVMIGVVIAALVLACLSIGIDSYKPTN